jgi:hypothetical protein
VWRDHVERDRQVFAVGVVFLKKRLHVPVGQGCQLALADLTDIGGRHTTVLGPLVVLPRLEPLPSGIAGVLAHERSATTPRHGP